MVISLVLILLRLPSLEQFNFDTRLDMIKLFGVLEAEETAEDDELDEEEEEEEQEDVNRPIEFVIFVLLID